MHWLPDVLLVQPDRPSRAFVGIVFGLVVAAILARMARRSDSKLPLVLHVVAVVLVAGLVSLSISTIGRFGRSVFSGTTQELNQNQATRSLTSDTAFLAALILLIVGIGLYLWAHRKGGQGMTIAAFVILCVSMWFFFRLDFMQEGIQTYTDGVVTGFNFINGIFP